MNTSLRERCCGNLVLQSCVFQYCRGYGYSHGNSHGYGYGDCNESPWACGDSMGIFEWMRDYAATRLNMRQKFVVDV